MFGKPSTKKKIKYLGHISTKSNNFFLNEREIFKVSSDTKSLYVYCSKVSPFASIQNLSLFTHNTIKNIFQCLFFIALISCPILSFKSAISLTFVLHTFVLMHPHRKKSSGIKSRERDAQ